MSSFVTCKTLDHHQLHVQSIWYLNFDYLPFHTAKWYLRRRLPNWTVCSICKWSSLTLLFYRKWCPIRLDSMAEKKSFFHDAFARETLGNTIAPRSSQCSMVLIDVRSQLRMENNKLFHPNTFAIKIRCETHFWMDQLVVLVWCATLHRYLSVWRIECPSCWMSLSSIRNWFLLCTLHLYNDVRPNYADAVWKGLIFIFVYVCGYNRIECVNV